MIIIEQRTQFHITIISIMNATMSSRIETSLYRISTMKSRARAMHTRQTAQARIRVYSSVTDVE